MVDRRDDDLFLPKAIRSYVSKIDKGFEQANAILFKVASRPNDYYYTNISGYIHAHPASMADPLNIVDLALSNPPEPQFLNICRYADEFISDLYLVRNRFHWDTIPELVRQNAAARLGDKLTKFLTT